MKPRRFEVDVAVVGGGFSGSSLALLMRRADPSRRVLILERKEAFDRKVGESSIELSAWFMLRVLRLGNHLFARQIPKYGLRFWFHNEKVHTLADASELGNLYQTRVPSFHIDRAILDEHVLALASAEGALLWRPSRVTDWTLHDGGPSTLEVETADGPARVQARWVVDATGRKATLARRLGLLHPIPEHPIRAVWARYQGVRDFDGDWLPGREEGKGGAVCLRGLSTNHLVGAGYWIWSIPLPDGDTSVGVVWDKRICDLPKGGSLGERFEGFLRATPAGRELMQGAVRREADLHLLNDLPYRVERIAGDGWAMVGDAAGFIDPFYSPGLDWAGLTCTKTSKLILDALRGEEMAEKIEGLNREFTRGFRRWVEALYLDKYFYMGDAELMGLALRLEVALYYFGVVTPPYREGIGALSVPFSAPVSEPFYRLLRFFNRRLARLARLRLRAGTYGRRNAGHRDLLPGFALGASSLKWIPKCLAMLIALEIRSLPDYFAARHRTKRPAPAPAPASREELPGVSSSGS
jgi:flavin-dependent dehydrogenase